MCFAEWRARLLGGPGVEVRGPFQHALPGRTGAPGGAAQARVGGVISAHACVTVYCVHPRHAAIPRPPGTAADPNVVVRLLVWGGRPSHLPLPAAHLHPRQVLGE